jgi:lipopolysaccharide biosynthesis glycosyltransferase
VTHVALAGDDRYAMPLGVAMRSLVDAFDAQGRLVLHVVDGGISSENRRKIGDCVDDPRVDLRWLEAPQRFVSMVAAKRLRYPASAFYRLALADLIGEDVDRLVYLDGDLVVLDDVAELARKPIGEQPLLAVPEAAGAVAPYVNTGVMVMNLAAWRERNLGGLLVEYLLEQPEACPYIDQDAINHLLGGESGHLEPRWNVLPRMFEPEHPENYYDAATLREATRRPAIVHFATRPKPWQPASHAPAAELWWRALGATPWAGFRPSRRELVHVMGERGRFWWWRAMERARSLR